MARSNQKQEEQLIHDLSRWLSRRRLVTPAILVLDILRPFGFLVGQLLLLGEPLLGFLFDGSQITAYADLLAERSGVERLLAQLSAAAGEYDRG